MLEYLADGFICQGPRAHHLTLHPQPLGEPPSGSQQFDSGTLVTLAADSWTGAVAPAKTGGYGFYASPHGFRGFHGFHGFGCALVDAFGLAWQTDHWFVEVLSFDHLTATDLELHHYVVDLRLCVLVSLLFRFVIY